MKIVVVAEAASNHGGDMKLAKRYAVGAKWAGCDVVKYQYYNVDDQFLPREDPRFERVRAAQLSLEQLSELWDHCENIGVKFLVTPFASARRVEDLASLGLRRVKIREADSGNGGMVKRALQLFDEVYISTTAVPVDDMSLRYNPHIRWLYTVPKYPAGLGDLELARAARFDGYSNHVPDIAAPLAVAAAAASLGKPEFILEVHVTLDRSHDNLDRAVSLDLRELRALVGHLRSVERIG